MRYGLGRQILEADFGVGGKPNNAKQVSGSARARTATHITGSVPSDRQQGVVTVEKIVPVVNKLQSVAT